MVGITGAPASVKIADIIAKLPHVVAVAPVLIQLSTAGNVELVYGIDLKCYDSITGGFRFVQGGTFQGPDDALVDDIYARSHTVKPGDQIEILNHNFRVAGVVERGMGARKFLPLATMQELNGSQGKASYFYVKLDNPSNAGVVVDEIKNVPGMGTYVVRAMKEWLLMMTPENTPGLSSFIRVVVGISVIIGFMVIFQAMYTAVMERTREIGILKSIGASKFYIMNVILRESTLLSICGIVVGVAFSELARAVILKRLFPSLPVEISGGWIARAMIIAVIGALAGAIYPALKAASKDPIEALAYE